MARERTPISIDRVRHVTRARLRVRLNMMGSPFARTLFTPGEVHGVCQRVNGVFNDPDGPRVHSRRGEL
jgi:hypothetical protein